MLNIYEQLLCSGTVLGAGVTAETKRQNYGLFFFFTIIVYYRILNRLPCATQEDLGVYLFSHIYQFVSASPKLPIQPSLCPSSPLATTRLFSMSVFLFQAC